MERSVQTVCRPDIYNSVRTRPSRRDATLSFALILHKGVRDGIPPQRPPTRRLGCVFDKARACVFRRGRGRREGSTKRPRTEIRLGHGQGAAALWAVGGTVSISVLNIVPCGTRILYLVLEDRGERRLTSPEGRNGFAARARQGGGGNLQGWRSRVLVSWQSRELHPKTESIAVRALRALRRRRTLDSCRSATRPPLYGRNS